MADNIFDIPLLCPIKFFPRKDPKYPSFDNAPWLDIIPAQNKRPSYNRQPGFYTQKWFNDGTDFDPIRLQIPSTFTPIQLDLLDCTGAVVSTYLGTSKADPAILTGWGLYEWDIEPPLLDQYYWQLSVGVPGTGPEDPGTLEQWISEPQATIAKKDGTLLFRYKHTRNYFDVVFSTGIEFYFRCEGWIGRIMPKVKGTDWEDQPLNLETITAKPYREFPVNIGQQAGVADWVTDKVNRIQACDTVYTNDVQYTRPDGNELTEIAIRNWPTSAWTVNVRQTKNRNSLRTQNGNSPALFFLVTYNINTRLFGTQNAPPSTNPITITRIE